ncbi:MAG: bifunctional riboflavin kinase/FAD synthetase [Acidimicrobiales bacterium]
MQIVHEGAPIPPAARGSVVSLGMFDGVHVGHQTVIARAVASATGFGTRAVVVTFDRHPASVVRPDAAVRLLTDLHQRAERIGRLGVDIVYVTRFDEERSLEDPTVFVDELVRHFAPQAVVVGEDFHFGHRRRGDLPLLETAGAAAGFKVEGVGSVSLDGIGRVSSTLVREAVAAGDVALAARLLGRSHAVRGVVEHGDERGRALGFPTANVAVPGDIQLPADGVYAGSFLRDGGTAHPAAISVGRRPTFYADRGTRLVEAHLVDFDGDLYGEHPEVVFDSWIRGQVRFDGVDGLVTQMRHDVEKVRQAESGAEGA